MPSQNDGVAIPAIAASATLVIRVLESLFKWFGKPLVIKCDNDGAFVDEEGARLAREGGMDLRVAQVGLGGIHLRLVAGDLRGHLFLDLEAARVGFDHARDQRHWADRQLRRVDAPLLHQRVGRHRQDGKVIEPRVGPYQLGCRMAIHLRHLHIHQHYINSLLT